MSFTPPRRHPQGKLAIAAATLATVLAGCEIFTSPDADPCYADRITISPEAPAVDVGEVVPLGAVVTLRGSQEVCRPERAIVGWASLSQAVAVVANQGAQRAEIRGVAPGTASIVATAGADSAAVDDSGRRKTDTVVVQVTPVTVASIVLSTTQVALVVGNSAPVTATVRNTRNEIITARSTITWTVTSNPAAVTVSPTGVITGVAKGPARVTATATAMAGSATATVDVTVSDPPNVSVAAVSIDGPATVQAAKTIDLTVTARAGDGTILTDRAVTWSSDAPTKAAVAPKAGAPRVGVVTGDKVGKATITATVEGKQATLEVTVIPGDVARIVMTPSTASLRIGRSVTIGVELFDARDNLVTAVPLAWSSSSPTTATVDGSGVVTGVGQGSATIQVKAQEATGTAAVGVTLPRIAYGIANQPQAASYLAAQALTSGTGPITVTRQAPGSYRVRFPGQQSSPGETETVLVTRYGEGNSYRKAAGWSTTSTALEADVLCYAFGGTPADAEFAFTLLGDGVLGGRFGFTLTDQPSVPGPYTPPNSYNSSPSVPAPIRVTRASLGQYTVTFAGNGGPSPNDAEALHVAAVGAGGSRCNFSTALTGESILVRCYAGAVNTGPVDTRFAITLFSRGRGGGRVAGATYAVGLDGSEIEDAGTYFLSQNLAYNSSAGTVDATKLPAIGRYEVVFHGLVPSAGTPFTVHVADVDADEAMFCNAAGWTVSGSDVRVTVTCWNTDTGEPEDEEFYVIVVQ